MNSKQQQQNDKSLNKKIFKYKVLSWIERAPGNDSILICLFEIYVVEESGDDGGE